MKILKTLSPVVLATAASLLLGSAHAQVDSDCTGANPGTVTCNGPLDTPAGPAAYANGITHDATAGSLTVNVGNGVTSFGTGGFTSTATGNNSITMTRGSGALSAVVATGTRSASVISATTENGDINISTSGIGTIQGVAANSQYGVRVQSTGTGDINLAIGQTVTQAGAATAVGVAAIYAQSTGGDIDITTGTSAITGRQYGIRTVSTGDGDTVITINGQVRHSTTAGVGIAAIDAVAELGDITLNVNSNISANGEIISLQGGGLTTLNLNAQVGALLAQNASTFIRMGGTGQGVVNIAGGVSTFGTLRGGIDASQNTGGITINNEALSGAWSFSGTSLNLGSGDDRINNRGLILMADRTSTDSPALLSAHADMGAGNDIVLNEGTMVIGAQGFGFTAASTVGGDAFLGKYRIEATPTVAAEASFAGLERFENKGLIVLGAHAYYGGIGGFGAGDAPANFFGQRFYSSDETGKAICRQVLRGIGLSNPPPNGFLCTDSVLLDDTDRVHTTVLSMPGTAFVGLEGSRILLDAVFGEGIGQSDCGTRSGGPEVFYRLLGADCINLEGGSTSGSSQIIVRDARPRDQGASNPEGIVVIDVAGGTSAADHFTLSPDSDSYRATAGGRGVIDKGLFVFPLIYDASTQQHKLVGIPGASALQLPLITHAAQALSRQATASGLDERSQNLRASLRNGTTIGGGFWGEFSQSSIERDLVQPMSVAGSTFAFNNDFEQDSNLMMLGGDFVIPSGERTAWLVGGSIGYINSDMGFTESGNHSDFDGVALGVHGGYLTGNWFFNAGYSQSFLQVDDYVSTFNLSTEGSGADTKAQTQSVRIDGGRRFSITDAVHVEPLVAVSWVRADFDDLVIASPDNPLATSNTAKFGNAVSLRGALGARLGFDQAISALRLHYALTGRYWNEFEGKTDVRIASTGTEAFLSDTFDGSFLDLAGRISLSDAQGHISGYLDATSVIGDDYSSLGFSAGFRYQW